MVWRLPFLRRAFVGASVAWFGALPLATLATLARIASGRSNASVTIVTLTVLTEPGGRYGAIRAIVSGRPIAKPTRKPASAEPLLAVRTVTRLAWSRRLIASASA